MKRVQQATSLGPRGQQLRRPSILLLGGVLAATLYLTRAQWLPAIGAFLVVSDPLVPADMILPLAGDLDRVSYAAALYRAGYAEDFLLTNLPLSTRTARAAHLERVLELATSNGVDPAHIVVVPEVARTTFSEAQNVRAALERRDTSSLLVVTSPWHTRRSRIALRTVFRDSPVKVSVIPVSGLRTHAYYAGWWRVRSTLKATVTEYLKLAAATVGIR